MKKISRLILGTIAGLVLASVSSQAQWVYYDVSDGLTNTITSVNTYDNWSGNVLWGQGTDNATTYGYRYRFMSGPGVVSWNSNAYTGFATQNQFPTPGFGTNDPPIYTLVTGLTPGQFYGVRVYAIMPGSATNANIAGRSRFGAQFSLNGGSTWSAVDTKGSVTINWVNNATDLGVLAAAPTGTGDNRMFALLPGSVQADGSGVARIDLRLPATLQGLMATPQNNDRFHFDGYALTVIPEPGTVAVLGVGLSGLVMMLRRKRS